MRSLGGKLETRDEGTASDFVRNELILVSLNERLKETWDTHDEEKY